MLDHEQKTPFTWGLDKIDDALTKPDFKQLIILSGYASVGKTEFTYFLARKNADLGNKVCYLSLEMPVHELAKRYAVKSAGLSYLQYQNKTYNKDAFIVDLLNAKYKQFMTYPNIEVIGDEKMYMLNDLIGNYPKGEESERGVLDKMYHNGCRMFIIDNLGKIGGFDNELKAHEQITSQLQRWKNKMNACVILLHHMAKPEKGKMSMPGGISGIRGSQKIIDNATQVVEIFRNLDPDETDDEERCKVQLRQYKNTMAGQNGLVDFYFDKGTYVPGVPMWVLEKRPKKSTSYPAPKKKKDDPTPEEETGMPRDKD